MVTATPDGKRRLSEGFLVEASVLARLLGIRLLRLEANVIVSPAALRRAAPIDYDAPVRSSVEAPALPPARSAAIGGRLANAERIIDEGAASLAAARATRLDPPRRRAR